MSIKETLSLVQDIKKIRATSLDGLLLNELDVVESEYSTFKEEGIQAFVRLSNNQILVIEDDFDHESASYYVLGGEDTDIVQHFTSNFYTELHIPSFVAKYPSSFYLLLKRHPKLKEVYQSVIAELQKSAVELSVVSLNTTEQ